MVIPHYKSLNMEPLKSLLFNLEIEKKSKQSQEAEPLSSLFGPHRSGFGYANWGSLDIGFEDPEDINYYQQKQG